MAAPFKLIVIVTALGATLVAPASGQAAPTSGAGRRAPRNRTTHPRPPAPSPAPPPPVAMAVPARHAPMDDGAFGGLVTSVRGESFSEAQVTVIEQAAVRNYFRVAQVSALIDTVAFSATKLRVLELCAPHIVDPDNVFSVFDAFAFSADQEQARQILRRNGL